MTGRGSRTRSTTFICRNILSRLSPTADDIVIDVGCGDGTLLSLLSGLVSRGIGIAPTDEEIERLSRLHEKSRNLTFQRALIGQLGLPDGIAHKVVCNSLLHEIPSNEVEGAIQDLIRICRPGGLIWIGEVLQCDDPSTIPSWIPRTLHPLMRHFWSHAGFAPLDVIVKSGRVLAGLLVPGSHFQFRPPSLGYISPSKVVSIAERAGARVLWSGPHVCLSAWGRPRKSLSRVDFLLRREQA
jgi:SAM-dependent methyltransferase